MESHDNRYLPVITALNVLAVLVVSGTFLVSILILEKMGAVATACAG